LICHFVNTLNKKGVSMIEIAPVSTTAPIKKINKIIREGEKPSKQTAKPDKKEHKDDDSNEQVQHIDEIV
jgi:hypothetical protein